MQNIFLLSSLALVAAFTDGGTALAKPGQPAISPMQGAEMLPPRTLNCVLGRALNLDPTKSQSVGDVQYEGAHKFSLFLPSIPKHQGPLPDPSADPEPVHPATRILSDPSALARDSDKTFRRVIDLWPHRVELISSINDQFVRLIILSDIDAAKGTANLFMTRASDAASLDLNNVYQGGCAIDSARTVRSTNDKPKRQRASKAAPGNSNS